MFEEALGDGKLSPSYRYTIASTRHDIQKVKPHQRKWVDRFMKLAHHIAEWSKDDVKVGAVLVTAEGKIAGIGYNGLLPGIDDSLLYSKNRTLKHAHMIHAEQNALANMTIKSDEPLYMFVTLPPCVECAKSITLNGNIRTVFAMMQEDGRYNDKWDFDTSYQLLHNMGIEYIEIDDNHAKRTGYTISSNPTRGVYIKY